MKRVLSAVCVFIMLVTLAANVFAAGEENYSKAYQILRNTGVIGSEWEQSYDMNKLVTRGEFASMTASLLGMSGLHMAANMFNDVAGHKYESAIALLASEGMVGGFSDGSFRPEDPIMYEQAMKILVSVTGYDVLSSGISAYDYTSAARNAKIVGGVLGKPGEALRTRDAIQMLFNTATSSVYVQTKYGDNRAYELSKNKTVFSERLDIGTVKGIVTATRETAFTGESRLGKGQVEIDGEIYMADGAETSKYLGYCVTAYYRKDTNEKEVLSLWAEDINQTVVIKAEDVAKDRADFSFENFLALSGDRVVKYSVDGNADLIYNGKAYPNFTTDTLKPEAGNVTLLDNNGDGIYDLVFVNEHENFVVAAVSVIEKAVYDKYGKNIYLDDTDARSYVRITTQYGEELALSDLKEWDVLAVTQSMPGGVRVVNIVVINDPVTGYVGELDEQNGTITIDREQFKIARNLLEAISSGKAGISDIYIGDRGYFYLDSEEKIAAVKLEANRAWQYAYLINANFKPGLGNELRMQVVTGEGVVTVFNGAKKIELDGESSATGAEVLARLKTNGEVVPQVIKYKLNSEDEVNAVDTAYMHPTKESKEANLVRTCEKERRVYATGTKRFSSGLTGGAQAYKNDVMAGADTIVFLVPKDGESAFDQSLYFARDISYFVNDRYYTISAYDTDAVDEAQVIVVNPDVASGSFNLTTTSFVESISETIDADGEIKKVIRLRGYGGQQSKFEEYKAGVFDGIEAGDFIRYSLNTKNQIDEKSILFSYKNEPKTAGRSIIADGSIAQNANAQSFMQYGVIYMKHGSFIKATTEIGGADTPTATLTYNAASTRIYLFDSSNDKFTQIAERDLEDYIYERNNGARAVWVASYNNLNMLVIYK